MPASIRGGGNQAPLSCARHVPHLPAAALRALQHLQQLRRGLRPPLVSFDAVFCSKFIPGLTADLGPLFLARSPWLGTCVGKGNYRLFCLFLTSLAVHNALVRMHASLGW